MDVERTELPGIGVQFAFVTRSGFRFGLVAHREGRRDLVLYDPEEPGSAIQDIVLDADEAVALGELLGGAKMVERFNWLHREIDDLVSRQILVEATSPFAERPLGDTRARQRTGASIVAIVRDEDVKTGPGPREVLRAGDRLVTVGTPEAVDAVEGIVNAQRD